METGEVKRPEDNWFMLCFSWIWATTAAAAAQQQIIKHWQFAVNDCGSERTWAGNKELSSTRTTSQLVTVDSDAEQTESLSCCVSRVLGHYIPWRWCSQVCWEVGRYIDVFPRCEDEETRPQQRPEVYQGGLLRVGLVLWRVHRR